MNFNPRMILMLIRLGMRFLPKLMRNVNFQGLQSFGRKSAPGAMAPVKAGTTNPLILKFWTHYAAQEVDIVERYLDEAGRDPILDKVLEDIHEDVFFDLSGPDARGEYTFELLADGDVSALKAARDVAKAAPKLQMTKVTFKKL